MPSGALGGEGLHRGGGPPGESQERRGVGARGRGGTHDQTDPPGHPPMPAAGVQVVHSHQGELRRMSVLGWAILRVLG